MLKNNSNRLRVKTFLPLAFRRAGSNPRLRTQGEVEGARAHDSSGFIGVQLEAKLENL